MANSVLEVPNIIWAELGAAQPQLVFSNFETNSFRLVFRGQARTEVKWRTEKMTPQNSFELPTSDQEIVSLFIVICSLISDVAMDNPPCPALVENENQEVVSEDDGKKKNIGEALVHEVQ